MDWNRAACVVFCKTREEWGGLSNMASGYPLLVAGQKILSSEALYQACRFPHRPEVQRTILAQRSPMAAKMVGKPHRADSRPDWDDVRVELMRWCLAVKAAQHPGFRALLRRTGTRPIVELSRKDDFWGAKELPDGALRGTNQLGLLLVQLRDGLPADAPAVVPPPSVPGVLLLDEPVGEVVPVLMP